MHFSFKKILKSEVTEQMQFQWRFGCISLSRAPSGVFKGNCLADVHSVSATSGIVGPDVVLCFVMRF